MLEINYSTNIHLRIFSCVFNFDFINQNTFFSLRSTDDRTDVSKIAKKLGGGGHRNAAGCMVNEIKFDLGFDLQYR